MSAHLVNAIIWWLGALGALSILCLVTGVIAWTTGFAATRMARNLMEFVRFATARYWVARLEKEGLTIMQTEYRRMVAERNPQTLRELSEVNSAEEARLRALTQDQADAHQEPQPCTQPPVFHVTEGSASTLTQTTDVIQESKQVSVKGADCA